MSPEEMKQHVREVMEGGYNRQDVSAFDDYFQHDYRRSTEAGEPSVNSLEEHKTDIQRRFGVFGKGRFRIEDMVAENDTVAVRFYLEGTHAGEFMGRPATGRSFRQMKVAFFKFRDGKIASSHILSDTYGLLRQIDGESLANG